MRRALRLLITLVTRLTNRVTSNRQWPTTGSLSAIIPQARMPGIIWNWRSGEWKNRKKVRHEDQRPSPIGILANQRGTKMDQKPAQMRKAQISHLRKRPPIGNNLEPRIKGKTIIKPNPVRRESLNRNKAISRIEAEGPNKNHPKTYQGS